MRNLEKDEKNYFDNKSVEILNLYNLEDEIKRIYEEIQILEKKIIEKKIMVERERNEVKKFLPLFRVLKNSEYYYSEKSLVNLKRIGLYYHLDENLFFDYPNFDESFNTSQNDKVSAISSSSAKLNLSSNISSFFSQFNAPFQYPLFQTSCFILFLFFNI
jgi:hypothetical protein